MRKNHIVALSEPVLIDQRHTDVFHIRIKPSDVLALVLGIVYGVAGNVAFGDQAAIFWLAVVVCGGGEVGAICLKLFLLVERLERLAKVRRF